MWLVAQRDGESAVSGSGGRALAPFAARRPSCMATLVSHLGVVISKQIVQLRVFNSHRFVPAVAAATTRVLPGVDAPAETVILNRTDEERCSLLNSCTEPGRRAFAHGGG